MMGGPLFERRHAERLNSGFVIFAKLPFLIRDICYISLC
jgi:hypothetical protein